MIITLCFTVSQISVKTKKIKLNSTKSK